MIKGLSKRIIVVNPPKESAFEQAIFILRSSTDNSSEALRNVMLEAEETAASYAASLGTKRKRQFWKK